MWALDELVPSEKEELMRRNGLYFLAGAGVVVAALFLIAAGGQVGDPNGVAPDRYVYYKMLWQGIPE